MRIPHVSTFVTALAAVAGFGCGEIPQEAAVDQSLSIGPIPVVIFNPPSSLRDVRTAHRAEREQHRRFVTSAAVLTDKDSGQFQLGAARATIRDAYGQLVARRNAVFDEISDAMASRDGARPETTTEAALAVFLADLHIELSETEVGARGLLFRDAECVDVVEDEVFFKIAQAIMDDDRESYIAGLENLRRALHCMSMDHATELANAYATAYDATFGRFADADKNSVRRVLSGQLLNVALIIHDATKWSGPNGLYRLLQDESAFVRDTLIDGSGAVPMAGLWLEAPAAGGLARIGPLCEDARRETLLSIDFRSASDLDRLNIVDQGRHSAPSRWQVSSGRLNQYTNIHDNNLSESTPTKRGTIAWTGSRDWQDYEVRVRFSSPDDDGLGVVARYRDSNNYYVFSLDRQRTNARLVRVRSGTWRVIAENRSHVGYARNIWSTMALSVVGDRLVARLNGETLFDIVDATPLSRGAAGMYSWGSAGVRFDDLSVSTLTNVEACCVSATGLFDALTDPVRLGLGTCPAVAFIDGCFDVTQGYVCDAHVCGDGLAQATGLPGIDDMRERGESRYSIELDRLRAAICAPGGGAREGEGGFGGDTSWESLVDLGGEFGCLHPDAFANRRLRERQISCIAAAAGHGLDDRIAALDTQLRPAEHASCGDPRALGSKKSEVAKVWIKGAAGCAAGGKTGGVVGCAWGFAAGSLGHATEVVAEAVDGIFEQRAEQDRLRAEIAERQKAIQEAWAKRAEEEAARAADERRKKAEQRQKEAEARQQAEDDKRNWEECRKVASHEDCVDAGENPPAGETMCADGAGACDSCSPAAAAAEALRECIDDPNDPRNDELPANGDLPSPAPQLIQPDPNGVDPELAACLDDALSDWFSHRDSDMSCAALRCNDGQTPEKVNGICSCTGASAGELTPPGASCAVIQCAEGSDVVIVNGECMCGWTQDREAPERPGVPGPRPGL